MIDDRFTHDAHKFVKDMNCLSDDFLHESCTVDALVHDLRLAVDLLSQALNLMDNKGEHQ